MATFNAYLTTWPIQLFLSFYYIAQMLNCCGNLISYKLFITTVMNHVNTICNAKILVFNRKNVLLLCHQCDQILD